MTHQPTEALSLWRGVIRYRPAMRDIAADICAKHQITFDELIGTDRAHRVAHPRQEFMARARALGHFTYPQIGRFLNKDHSSVHHGVRAHAARHANHPDLDAWNHLGEPK